MKNSTIVLIILIIVVGVGLYYVATKPAGDVVSTNSSSTSPVSTDGPRGDWKTYQGTKLSLQYAPTFMVNDVAAAAPTDWRIDANNNPGILDLSLTLPKSFEPQTNFSDAKLTIGESADAKAVADCLTPDQSGGGGPSMTTKVINGVSYTVFSFSDAGAGNLYDSTSYRVMRDGTCFALEYTIHSTQIANYPPSAGISAFDEAKVKALLDTVVGTVVLH